jgi:hypothetical protein
MIGDAICFVGPFPKIGFKLKSNQQNRLRPNKKTIIFITKELIIFYAIINYISIKINKKKYTENRVNSLQFLFYLVCEATGTAATPGLLCQPRVIVNMIVEKQMECRLAGETEVLGENLPAPAPLLSITKSHMTRPGFEPGPPRWEAGD